MEKVPYDVPKDFAPVTLVATVPEMLVVASNVPAKNMEELVALAKAQPGKLNFASAGLGSLPHLAGELFKLTARSTSCMCPTAAPRPPSTICSASRCRWRSSICRCCCRISRPARCARLRSAHPTRAHRA